MLEKGGDRDYKVVTQAHKFKSRLYIDIRRERRGVETMRLPRSDIIPVRAAKIQNSTTNTPDALIKCGLFEKRGHGLKQRTLIQQHTRGNTTASPQISTNNILLPSTASHITRPPLRSPTQ